MPKPSDYKAIHAWGKHLGSMDYYIEQVQEQAAADNAPLDAIYLRIGPAQWVTVRDLAPENRFRVKYEADNPTTMSRQMLAAIAGLVRAEDEHPESPPRTDDEVRGYGLVHDLTKAEIEQLVEIARHPIGY